MDNIEKLIAEGIFWLGVSGVCLSAVAAWKKYVTDAPYYDNTGLLDRARERKKGYEKPTSGG